MNIIPKMCMGFVFASILAAPAYSIERIESQTQSCNTIKRTIIKNGAVILRYQSKRNASNVLFDRYVASSRQCAWGEIAEWKTASAQGGKSCRLLVCNSYDPSNYPFGIPFRTLGLN